jgi:hypothetical protein
MKQMFPTNACIRSKLVKYIVLAQEYMTGRMETPKYWLHSFSLDFEGSN